MILISCLLCDYTSFCSVYRRKRVVLCCCSVDIFDSLFSFQVRNETENGKTFQEYKTFLSIKLFGVSIVKN